MLKQEGTLAQNWTTKPLIDWSLGTAKDNEYFVVSKNQAVEAGQLTYDAAYKTAPTTEIALEDFPTANTALPPLLPSTPVQGVAVNAPGDIIENTVATIIDDPGHNIFDTHVFKINLPTNEIRMPTKEYKFGKTVPSPNNYPSPNYSDWYSFGFPYLKQQKKWLVFRNYPKVSSMGVSDHQKAQIGEDNDKRALIPNKKNAQFLFHQDTIRRVFNWKYFQGTPSEFAKKVDDVFYDFYLSTSQPLPGTDGYFVSNSIYDINTKIGTPYDFQTLLLEGINDSANGVDSKQPSYDKLYNYYDGQYEPIVISAIENGIMDEKGLPSIYDFLYLDQQPGLAPYVKIPDMSLEETNLASINQWLDNFAKQCSRYMQTDKYPKYSLVEVATKIDKETTLDGDTFDKYFIVPSEVQSDPRNSLKYQPTLKKVGLLAVPYIATVQPDYLYEIKDSAIPTWLSELKTGIYFSEKQLDTFTEALDKDTVFPHALKVNIPIETVGPIAKLLSQYNLLDSLNTYAASTIIPNENNISTYQRFAGCVINGLDGSNFNNLKDLKLPSFKIHFNKDNHYTLENVISDGTQLSTRFNTLVPFGPNDVDEPLADRAIFYSWISEQLNILLEQTFKDETDYKLPQPPKTFFKIIPLPQNDPDSSESEHSVLPYPAIVQMWTWCDSGPTKTATQPGCFRGFRSPASANNTTNFGVRHVRYTSAEHLEWKKEIKRNLADANTNVTSSPFLEIINKLNKFGAEPSDIYDLSDADKTPFSIFSEKTGISDLYIDSLTAGIAPEVLVYGVNKNVTSNDSIQMLLEKLKTISLKKKLSRLFVDGKLMRTPNDIHSGKLAHQETLMYEIAKYSISDDNTEKYIQSIFLPITEKSQLSYYDTQVLPFKNYFYKIFAHKAIVGTKYKAVPYNHATNNTADIPSLCYNVKPFLPPPDYNNNNPKASDTPKTNYAEFFVGINYEIEPYVEVVRVPYYNVSAVNLAVDKINYSRIEDYPPLAPQINIVPFKGVNNKILIMLNNSIGQIEQYPKVLFEYEKKSVSDLALAQDRIPGDKLIYKSDDAQGTFSCFRVDNLFDSYEKLPKDTSIKLRELESNSIEKNDSYIDFITPNQTYYYVFRFTDIHNKISNPTNIYKVRMEQPILGSSYLTVEVVDIRDVQKKNHDLKFRTVKNMQKYLYVQPSFDQSVVTAEPDIEKKFFKDTTVSLGDPECGSVFGKKFKIRISSKQTGKKIDINLTVKDPEIIINE